MRHYLSPLPATFQSLAALCLLLQRVEHPRSCWIEGENLLLQRDRLGGELAEDHQEVFVQGGEPVGVLGGADGRYRSFATEGGHVDFAPANAVQARLERQGYPLSLPAAWAILMGGLLRTGEDVSSVDPVQAMERYGDRPVLLLFGGRDDRVGRDAPADLKAAAEGQTNSCPKALKDACRIGGRSTLLCISSSADCEQVWVIAGLEILTSLERKRGSCV